MFYQCCGKFTTFVLKRQFLGFACLIIQVMFKVSVHNEAGMKEFVAGKNPIAKAIYEECVASVNLYELSKVEF